MPNNVQVLGNVSFEDARYRVNHASKSLRADPTLQTKQKTWITGLRDRNITTEDSARSEAALMLKAIHDVAKILNTKVQEAGKRAKYPYELSDYEISEDGVKSLEEAAETIKEISADTHTPRVKHSINANIAAHDTNRIPTAQIEADWSLNENASKLGDAVTVGSRYQPNPSEALRQEDLDLPQDANAWSNCDDLKTSSGKVRTTYWLDDCRGVMIARDTTSAMDIPNLCNIPGKGAMLTGISNYWLDSTFKDLAAKHGMSDHRISGKQNIDPNVSYVSKVTPLPVEVVLRRYVTGSAYKAYQEGQRLFGSHKLPEGLAKNARLNAIVVDPTIKGRDSDIRITDGVAANLVGIEDWIKIKDTAQALFAEAERKAKDKGLILVDTKFEFGKTADGKIVLIDEVLTPDSSRYWTIENYLATPVGQDPTDYSKEPLRDWVKSRDQALGKNRVAELKQDKAAYKEALGPVPDKVVQELAERYATIYYALTGQEFKTDLQGADNVTKRIVKNLKEHQILAA